MAYPSGSGSERLQRGTIHNMVNADTAFRFDGGITATGTSSYVVPANHIVTILSVNVTDTNSLLKYFQMVGYIGSTAMNFVYQERIPSKQTFVWNEKIVLHPTDKILVVGEAGAGFDVYYTYVEQDWS